MLMPSRLRPRSELYPCNCVGSIAMQHALYSGSAVGYSALMAAERRKWKYRDPSWPQVVWLYGLSLITVLTDLSDKRVLLGLGLMVLVTVFAGVKISRERRGKLERDAR